MEREDLTGFLSSFAIGAVAGAAVALLYAPRSGSETRQLIGDKVRRGTDYGREKLRDGADFAREKIEQGAEYGRQMADRVAGRTQEVVDQAADVADNAAAEAAAFGERRRKPRTV
jgi:gas vesicle protein